MKWQNESLEQTWFLIQTQGTKPQGEKVLFKLIEITYKSEWEYLSLDIFNLEVRRKEEATEVGEISISLDMDLESKYLTEPFINYSLLYINGIFLPCRKASTQSSLRIFIDSSELKGTGRQYLLMTILVSEFSPLLIQRQYWGDRSCLERDSRTEMVRLRRCVHRHCR